MPNTTNSSLVPKVLIGLGVLASVLIAQRLLRHFWAFGFVGKVGVVVGAAVCLYAVSMLLGGKTDAASSSQDPPRLEE